MSIAEATASAADASNSTSQPQEPSPDPPLVTALDIRVGKIVKVEEHPDADR